MKKLIMFSFLSLTLATVLGCSNGLPRSCFMRSWFCGKECQPEPAYSCYPDECSPQLGTPVYSNDSCPSCNVPSDNAGPTTFSNPSPSVNSQPLNYNPN